MDQEPPFFLWVEHDFFPKTDSHSIGSWPEGLLFAILFQPSTPRSLQPELSARAPRMFLHTILVRGGQSPQLHGADRLC